MTEAAPLKPLACPFCGSKKIRLERDDDALFGHCLGCDAGGPTSLTKSVAIAAWNRRAPQAEPVAWAKFDSDGNCLAWQVGAHRQSAELDTPLYAGHAPEPQAEQAAYNVKLMERRLGELMSEISEDCYCAGWMHGNEYTLWSMIAVPGASRDYGMDAVSEEDLAELKLLSDRLGGWVVWWDDDYDQNCATEEWGERFLPMAEWLKWWDKHGADYTRIADAPAALPPDPEVDVLIPEQPPEPFDCALIVRCAKWCGKEKCRDHDAIAHAELVKAARLVARVANGNQGLEGNAWKAALAALRAALPPEGAA